IAFLAESAVQGYDAQDRERLIELARRSGLPVIVQGMGFRPGQRAKWEDQVRFLEEARQRGAAIFSMLRTQPFMRPFNWRRATSPWRTASRRSSSGTARAPSGSRPARRRSRTRT